MSLSLRRVVRWPLLVLALLFVACAPRPAAMPAPTSTLPSVPQTRAAVLQVAGAHSYSTTFSGSENPISEGGNWINGGAVGLDWTDVATTPGKVFGTQHGDSANPFDDSIAVLSGTWGDDQAASATVFVSSVPMKCCPEVELHLRRTISPHFSGGYEFNCSVTPVSTYMGIVRWPGPIGATIDSFTTIAARSDMGCADGDVLGATAVGSTLTFYKNGVPVLSGTDATYTGGAPGVGFFLQYQTGIIANWGFTNFSANDAGSLPGGA